MGNTLRSIRCRQVRHELIAYCGFIVDEWAGGFPFNGQKSPAFARRSALHPASGIKKDLEAQAFGFHHTKPAMNDFCAEIFVDGRDAQLGIGHQDRAIL